MMRTTLVLLVCLFVQSLHGAEWRHWRGPFYNGSTDETNLPDNFGPDTQVKWVAELPGQSAATPIICGDCVFISSTDPQTDELVALCFSRRDGQLRWRRVVGTTLARDTRSTFAAPSPVTDGKLVVFFYGSGPLAAFDFAGRQMWKRDIQEQYGEFAFQWTFSSSPLLYEGLLYLQVLQRDTPVGGRGFADRANESYLLAMDPQTGREQWRVVRPSDAVAESREAFTSPIPAEYNGRKEILLAGGDCLTGHDPQNGKELWRWGTWNPRQIPHWRLVPSPVCGQGIVLACAPKGDPIYAIRGGGEGTLDDGAIAWTSADVREVSSDVPTPAFYDGDFFVLSKDRRCVSRVAPLTGTVKWTTQLTSRDKLEASPLLADGKVYVIDFAGRVVILDAKSGNVRSEIAMAEQSPAPIRSSIAAAGGNLFIRTNDKLYCIGN